MNREKSETAAELLPPSFSTEGSDISSVITQVDQHTEHDRTALEQALAALDTRQKSAQEKYETLSQQNAAQREEVMARLSRLTGEAPQVQQERRGRPKGSTNASTSRRGPRGSNEMSLVEALKQVLSQSGEPMGVSDLAEGAQKLGYKSKSASFRAIVNQTLIKDDAFKNEGRGVYALSGRAKAPKASQAPKAPKEKRGRKSGGVRVQSTNDLVLSTIQANGGWMSSKEIIEAVREKHPEVNGQQIGSALQGLRGRVVKGKRVGIPRLKKKGEAGSSQYMAIV